MSTTSPPAHLNSTLLHTPIIQSLMPEITSKRQRPTASTSRNDGDESPARGPKRPATRKRAPLACEECRSRKRRCDGAVPICGGCTKRRTECIYLAELQDRTWQQGMIQSLRSRLDELEEAERAQQRQQSSTSNQSDTQDQVARSDLVAQREPAPPPPVDQGANTESAGQQAPAQDGGGTGTAAREPNLSSTSDLDMEAWLPEDGGAASSPRPPSQGRHGISAPHLGLPPTFPDTRGVDIHDIHHLPPAGPSPSSSTLPNSSVLPGGSALPSSSTLWAGNAGRPPSQASPSTSTDRRSSVERLTAPIDRAISQVSPPLQGPKSLHSLSAAAAAVSTLPQNCTCDRFLRTTQWTLPLRRQADDLVRLYFTRVHRTYAILHQPTFTKQYWQLWEPSSLDTEPLPYSVNCLGLCRQKGLDKTFPATVNVVFALASLFAPNPPEQNQARAEAFFNVTQQIDLMDVIDEEGGIEVVQLLLLMGFYLQSTERFSKCWNITGLAIRMAQNMGLQLSPNDARRKGYSTCSLTQRETEMRVRVWHGCVLLDREISTLFGRTSMIRSEHLRLPLPEPIDDEYLSEDKAQVNTQPANLPSIVESFIETIKLYAILGQVLDRDESKSVAWSQPPESLPSGHTDAQSLLDLDTVIMEWRDSLPPHLRYDPWAEELLPCSPSIPDATGFAGPALRLYVRFLHVRVLILRGALEHLFLKYRDKIPPPQAKANPSVGRVQDWMLTGIAAQCVLSAQSLVSCLDTYIKTRNLAAWWYNISYLHTCGSVLLMGQLCSFDDSLVNRDSLTASWELCLRCLSGYTSLSSIASNSFNLLQESARRLMAERGRMTDASNDVQMQGRVLAPNQNERPNVGTGDLSSSLSATLVEAPLSAADPQANNVVSDGLPDLWGSDDPLGLGGWAVMPYLSQVAQLESLPQEFHDFDIFNIS